MRCNHVNVDQNRKRIFSTSCGIYATQNWGYFEIKERSYPVLVWCSYKVIGECIYRLMLSPLPSSDGFIPAWKVVVCGWPFTNVQQIQNWLGVGNFAFVHLFVCQHHSDIQIMGPTQVWTVGKEIELSINLIIRSTLRQQAKLLS